MSFNRYPGSMILSQCDNCDVYSENDGLVATRQGDRNQTRLCRDCGPELFAEQAERDKAAWLRGDREADVRMGYNSDWESSDAPWN